MRGFVGAGMVVLAACGARTSLGDPPDAFAPVCTATVWTRPGPCAGAQHECDDACGICATAETCFDQRCYVTMGIPRDDPALDISRAFRGDGEGMECIAPISGVLERVDAMIWSDQINGVNVVASTTCGGAAIETKVHLPSTQLATWPHPPYTQPVGTTQTIVLSPPLPVSKGETFRVMFYALGATDYYDFKELRSGVEQVSSTDIDPDCHFVATDGYGLPGDTAAHWDFGAQLFIHP